MSLDWIYSWLLNLIKNTCEYVSTNLLFFAWLVDLLVHLTLTVLSTVLLKLMSIFLIQICYFHSFGNVIVVLVTASPFDQLISISHGSLCCSKHFHSMTSLVFNFPFQLLAVDMHWSLLATPGVYFLSLSDSLWLYCISRAIQHSIGP